MSQFLDFTVSYLGRIRLHESSRQTVLLAKNREALGVTFFTVLSVKHLFLFFYIEKVSYSRNTELPSDNGYYFTMSRRLSDRGRKQREIIRRETCSNKPDGTY